MTIMMQRLIVALTDTGMSLVEQYTTVDVY